MSGDERAELVRLRARVMRLERELNEALELALGNAAFRVGAAWMRERAANVVTPEVADAIRAIPTDVD